MVKAKKKLLPKDFKNLLEEADFGKLKAVFDTCVIDARGGHTKQSALAFNECPDEFARWLVERGADISAGDRYGETPLHARAGHWRGRLEVLLELGADVHLSDSRGNTPLHSAAACYNSKTVNLLLKHGASIGSLNNDNQTPLVYALKRCNNINILGMSEIAEVLLLAQAAKKTGFFSRILGSPKDTDARLTSNLKDAVLRIGTDFEFHRSGFDIEHVDKTSAALDQLYLIFDVPPVPRRALHDGKSPIISKAAGWADCHQELWELLVPSSGAADTIQGEVVRVSGKIRDEFERNGGTNWDRDFKKMAGAFLFYVKSGVPLSQDVQTEAQNIVEKVKQRNGDTRRMCEMAVNWVVLNPKPLKLPPPDYNR